MKLIILGSGGFQTIPRPVCQCKVCVEARKKGVPYSRNGPSLFIEDINAVIDTPKDIINSVNRENIKKIERVFFTHWHPDHTEGFRLAEEIKTDWSNSQPFEIKNQKEPVKYIAPKEVVEQLRMIRSPLGSYLDFHQIMNFVKLIELEFGKEYQVENLVITPMKVKQCTNAVVSPYMIQEGKKKVVYFPCHTKAWKDEPLLKNIDLLITNCPWMTPLSKGQEVVPEHPLRDQLFSLEEMAKLKKQFKIKRLVVSHIEEMFCKSYDDLCKLEKQHGIEFAYDGMKITV